MNSNLQLFPPGTAGAGAPDSRRDAMGAYEALMAEGQQLSRVAAALRQQRGLQLSQLVPAAHVSSYAEQATRVIGAAGIGEVHVMAHDSVRFPAHLRDAADIALFYYQGCWDLVTTRCVAIVGTRQPGAAAVARTAEWVRRLVADGFTIVSGLASGIDTCAHQAALAAGGRTIAVLGTPLSSVYPPGNQELQRRIAAQQLLISHVPFVLHAQQTVHANREFFLQRNAVIAGLSETTIVMEAGDRSGALVAARHALRQGRRLLIADDCYVDTSLRWPQRLSAHGAVRVRDYGDIRVQLAASP